MPIRKNWIVFLFFGLDISFRFGVHFVSKNIAKNRKMVKSLDGTERVNNVKFYSFLVILMAIFLTIPIWNGNYIEKRLLKLYLVLRYIHVIDLFYKNNYFPVVFYFSIRNFSEKKANIFLVIFWLSLHFYWTRYFFITLRK